MRRNPATVTPVRLGISACLLGQKVCFDGGHKRDAFLVEVFGPYVEWVSVCPEVEMGLGVPRDTMRLERQGDDTRLIMPKTGADYTERLRTFAAQRLEALAGYVSDHLDSGDRGELTDMIDQYRLGLLPLIVPVTLLRHYVRKFQIPYLLD